MKNSPPLRAALLLLVFACLATRSAVAQDTGETVNLRPQWEQGQTARYQFWTTRVQETKVRFGDQAQETTTTVASEGEVTWTVDQVKPDGSFVCTMTLDWMTADLTTDDANPLQNDSRKGKGDLEMIHGLLKAMAGKPLEVLVNADGSIEEVDGVKAMRDAADNADLVPEELDFVETASDLASVVFAPEQANPGDTWSADFRWTHDVGHLEQDWRYTFEQIEDIAGVPVAVVTGTATDMKLDPNKLREEMPDDAPDVRVDLKDHSAESRVLFDLTRSEAVGRENRLETTIEMSIPLPDGRSIDRTIHETITSQTLRLEER